MARKRDLSNQQQELMIDQPHHPPVGLQNSIGYWNQNVWKWDCTRFEAQQVDESAMNVDRPAQNSQNRSNISQVAVEDDGSLCLKLGSGTGGSSFNDEPPTKRVARLPGGSGSGNHPTCQVDSCMVDLSNAKDYHRRHKVCESHSKAAQALVGKQMQRFCQQCSRFHVISEFDEGKRSCRRRLAGHNRRRRKTQPDDVAPQLLSSEVNENVFHAGLDLADLLAALTRAQGNEDNINGAPVLVPNKEQLIQLISKINSFSPSAKATTKLASSNILNKTGGEASPEHQSGSSGNSSSQSTLNLIDVLPRASQVSAPDALTNISQRSRLFSSGSEKTKSADIYQPDAFISRKRTTLDLSFIGGERSTTSCLSPADDSNDQVHNTQVNLPLQLFFSSPEDNNNPLKKADSSKYFSSDSSNQNEDRTPSSSPGVQLFPVKPTKQMVNHEKIAYETNAKVPAKRTPCGTMSFDLFGGSNNGVAVDYFQGSNQVRFASTCSEYSPSSSTRGAQELTRIISFKLFGKVPGHLPPTLRPEILAWLSNIPSQMESYIRPGCVVLSIYVSMPYASWEELDRNLLKRVSWLIQHTNVDIWKDGRFLVQTGNQLVSHNNGMLRLCKSWITPKAPELISVSPLAIVGGHETRVHLTGRNFYVGTKIHYTFMGGYITTELSDTTVNEGTLDGTKLCSCDIHIAPPSGNGRYFIEVENGFNKGNSFPIIVADSSICQELRQLEIELEADPKFSESTIEGKESDLLWPKAEVLNFLYELGWLFQMKRDSSNTLEHSIHRFNFLLTFSVEKDFSALVKKLLDTLVEEKMGDDGIPGEVSEMVSAVQLLHRAVKRRCRKMVDMLINYSIVNRDSSPSKMYIFPPIAAGPGGLTPLHIAACTSGSEDVIDALTNDPLELGLSCWDSQLDASGQSPCAYATLRNNLSYNQLVARKLSDRRSNQISLSVDGTTEQTFVYPSHSASHQPKHKAVSCSQCAILAARCSRRRVAGSHGIVARPFILSMLVISAVCVCVCLYFRGHPYTGMGSPFTWENLHYCTI